MSITAPQYCRQYAVGAEVVPNGGVHFRVWAPRRERVQVVFSCDEDLRRDAQTVELVREPDGYFSGLVADAAAGMHYQFLLDDDSHRYPDPASRYQPRGPHGPSQVIDPSGFEWTDAQWTGIAPRGQVIYEMHIGTYTQEGTWESAAAHLSDLANLGVTTLEIMPVADFPGHFGWGYDSVDLFAPTRLYGTPDDFRRFVDQAHASGLGVILDVIYNHLGPDGNYLPSYSADYLTDRYECEWGDAINFDGPGAGPVREFFLTNVAYWIREFHMDGFRFDATQSIFDSSPEHILAAISRAARKAAGSRPVYLVGENEPQEVRLVQSLESGGYGLDALWNDDFHHSAMVALTGRADAYYIDYRGTPQEFIATAKWGFLYQGQIYSWQKKRRGTPSLRLPPTKLTTFLQNHDQVANSASGERIHRITSPSRYRALTALFLLLPQTPMLFQGQEFAASAPFLFFADHEDRIAIPVAQGRAKFLAQFRALASPEMQARLADPGDPMTFARCKLNHDERQLHAKEFALHRDLLRLRREDPVFARQERGTVDGEIIAEDAFVLRFFGEREGDDRLLVVNLARDVHLTPSPQPLLAPPEDAVWEILWASEDPRYGGWGMPPMESETEWCIQGEASVVLKPRPTNTDADVPPRPSGKPG